MQWYLYDGLGSVVGLVDSSGNVTNTRKYDVYGAPRNAQTGSAHCFVGGLGHTSDVETGLVYMRARYYDAATGRFASEDPIRHGANWFVYANNDPVNLVDATGKEPTASQLVLNTLTIAVGILGGALCAAAGGAITAAVGACILAAAALQWLAQFDDPVGIGSRGGLGSSTEYISSDLGDGVLFTASNLKAGIGYKAHRIAYGYQLALLGVEMASEVGVRNTMNAFSAYANQAAYTPFE